LETIRQLGTSGAASLISYVILIAVIFIAIGGYVHFLTRQSEKLGASLRNYLDNRKDKNSDE
jgi:hypothetical protein